MIPSCCCCCCCCWRLKSPVHELIAISLSPILYEDSFFDLPAWPNLLQVIGSKGLQGPLQRWRLQLCHLRHFQRWKVGIVRGRDKLGFYLDVSKNGGTQQPWVFLLQMIILGCFGGTPIFGNTHLTPDFFQWKFCDTFEAVGGRLKLFMGWFGWNQVTNVHMCMHMYLDGYRRIYVDIHIDGFNLECNHEACYSH